MPLRKHKGGATSTDLGEVRYDLIPPAGLRCAARRAYIGAVRHGEFNYLRSVTEDFAKERLNHMMKHLVEFATYRRMEDLDAVIFNGMMIAEFKERGAFPDREDVVPPKRKK